MYRKFSLLFMLLLLMALFLGSCIEKTDKFSKKNNAGQIESLQPSQVDVLSDSMIVIHNNVQALLAKAELVKAFCDSVKEENVILQTENQQLKAQLAQARDEVIPAMRLQYESLFDMQQTAYKKLEDRLKSTNSELSTVQSKCSVVQADNVLLKNDLNNLSQWTKKYQHDSERSFIKVMFGAGKAPVPDVPALQLE